MLKILVICAISLLPLSVLAQYEMPINDTPVSELNKQGNAIEGGSFERRIATEIVAAGHRLDSDPRLETVVNLLTQRGRALFTEAGSMDSAWVQSALGQMLPALESDMGGAALNAALQEIATGLTQETNALLSHALSFEDGSLSDGPMTPDDNLISTVALRSGLEALRAAAGTSDLTMLNRLELEYGLTEGGLNGYSALTVQPLFESPDKRRSLMAQASYARKQTENQEADTDDWRETVNAGLSWRYVTPDERHMFGVNAFFDHQWPYHHNRMSVGVDYKTGLMGLSSNHYVGLSEWRGRTDGYEERALSGTDIELSGRLPDLPELELFLRGYHWDEQRTAILNPDGDDILGYRLAAEYTPISAFTFTAAAAKDNAMDSPEGQIMMRFNYRFGQGFDDFKKRPSYNLDSVVDRRFEKVRRNNEIRVQVRQDPDLTARVTFAQGANVSVGQSLAFGSTITTGGAVGDAATVVFGNGARLDVGQSTQVRVENDRIVLITGLIQFTTGSGGITVIAVPGGAINLIGTDVDVRVAGGTTTLRVRDGAADYTDDTGVTRVNTEQLAEAQDGDGLAPQIRAEGTAIYETHSIAAHAQLNRVGPAPSNPRAAPFADEDVSVTGTLAVGNTLTFTVPLTGSVTVSGSPRLRFTLGGLERWAEFTGGSGTKSLTFSYDVLIADEGLSTINTEEIEKNGGTLIGTNGAPMVRTVTGTLGGTIPVVTPVNTVGPVIAGVGIGGQTLSATPGTWTNADTVTGQWLSDGVVIPGETGLTYAVVYATDGTNLSYVETAINPSAPNTATSNVIQSPFTGPLDGLSASSAAAYSTRRLTGDHKAPLMRVRRSSDNAEADIGYDVDGNLDTAALLAFTGAGDGFVTTWYDQSGNARDASQATGGNQPRIVNAGVVEVYGSRPAMRFLGGTVNGFNTASNFWVGGGEIHTTYNSLPNGGYLFSSTTISGRRLVVRNDDKMWWEPGTVGGGTVVAGLNSGNLTFVKTGSPHVIRRDGIELWTGTGSAPINVSYNSIGLRWKTSTAINAFNGPIGEVISFDGIQLSTADRDALEANRTAYWGETP